MGLSYDQRLRNAIYQVKLSQMPGVHDNGEYVRELTVEEALDKVASIMGISVSTPKPLYFTDSSEGMLYSRVTSRWYDLTIYDNMVEVKYKGKWYQCSSERAAMNFINYKEIREDPTQTPIRDGMYVYHD